ncbi:M20/M25/M40 family metallo-hydrolase [Lacicoccus qingdaonensis]|uniref:Arginine utilization protein RocB n=1 Tax=Lacicoccus qingdaonensis TaxID=576118 RepID=A0A1G9G458_9BACL|nr:M20/M25/M40 family metallo-hydrolase [Salinicoccus qingdaonensis]SDK95407.1 Arginine utilization protein RocB [Salinicoccus qingdaonensis]
MSETSNTSWQTPGQLYELIAQLVSFDSRSGTSGEIGFPHFIKEKLMDLSYFETHPDRLHLVDSEEDRHALIAHYKADDTKDTVVLISHFDVVHTKEFGDLEEIAFDVEKLTEAMKERKDGFNATLKNDIESGDYIFGRGVMDMKMGLALHMSLIELAFTEEWPLNIILVTVPDEEVNSDGMRAAVKFLSGLKDSENLDLKLILNSEPSFSQSPQDTSYYIYTGSIGKIMPSALFYGVGTHAGEPLQGITSHFMSSYLTKEMEFNADFSEEKFGERTPPPVCLQQNDLKKDYSTQTSHHAYALYNVFTLERSPGEVMDIYRTVAERAMDECWSDYSDLCRKLETEPLDKIHTITFHDLALHVINKHGRDRYDLISDSVFNDSTLNIREKAIKITDRLMDAAKELAPAAILFLAPSYYPAVNASDDPELEKKIKYIQKIFKSEHDVDAKQIHYFNGISDLSYVNYTGSEAGWMSFMENMPVWGEPYTIPFKEMQNLKAPVLNVGPYGKDAHKMSERLHKDSAFIYTPDVLRKLMTSYIQQAPNN